MTLANFLSAHGSALILPLAVFEGPIVTIVTGFLAAQGFFPVALALFLLLGGDLIGDALYYYAGRGGAGPLALLARRAGLRGGVPERVRTGLVNNATRMLLIGKWTHSVGFIVLIGSGMVRVPIGQFLLVNLLAATPKIALLFALGYFAGDHYPFFARHALAVTLVLCAVGIAAMAVVLRHGLHPHRTDAPR